MNVPILAVQEVLSCVCDHLFINIVIYLVIEISALALNPFALLILAKSVNDCVHFAF